MRSSTRAIRTSAIALVAGALCWVLAAGGASGATTSLRDGSFSTDLVESTPDVQSPAAGATLTFPTSPISLSWASVPGTTSYDVQVSRHANASVDCTASGAFSDDRIVVSTTTSEPTWTPDMSDSANGSDIVINSSYCWRVRAAGGAPGSWSPGRRFTVEWTATATNLRFYNVEGGSIPRKASDPDAAAGDTLGREAGYLEWDGVAGATEYDIEIARAAGFAPGSILLTSKGHAGTRLLLPQLPDEDGYYYRVRAITATGVSGPWAYSTSFSIQRYTSSWVNPSAAFPAYGAVTNDARIGWDPVPGASYYEYQTATSPQCFFEPTGMSAHSLPYGDPAIPSCLLSEDQKSTTINNFVTFDGIFGKTTLTNMIANCGIPAPGTVTSPCPVTASDIPLSPDKIYWRVRPVWQLSQATESGFAVSGDIKMYGNWLLNEAAGYGRPNTFELRRNIPADYDEVSSPRCASSTNPGAGGAACLHLIDGPMSVNDASTNSSSMQLPVLRWGAFHGRFGNPGPGGYLVQIANDPYFNDIVVDKVAGSPDGVGIGSSVFDTQLSYSPKDGLPDDTEGDGYWWRVIPCEAVTMASMCAPFYYQGASGLSYLISGGIGFNDGAQPRTFGKQVASATAQVTNFSGSAPLLKVGPAGSTTDADFARGIQGADHYEFQYARTASFRDVRTVMTTVPRLLPYSPSGKAGENGAIESGSWYWRVRPVDANGLLGTWSDIATFDVNPLAPTGLHAAVDAVEGGATLRWTPVEGATSYEVAWSGGGAPATIATKQAVVHVPASAAGSIAWHVRASNGTWSNWAEGGTVAVPAATRLRYAVENSVVTAGAKAMVDGQLLLAGTASNGRTIQLQRKTTTCGVGGAYRQVARAVTGRGASQGMVRFGTKVPQNGCYRLAYAGDRAVSYSAPFSIGAKPKAVVKVRKRIVRNGASFCVTVKSPSALTGTTQVQYKVGKKWLVARSGRIRMKKAFSQCAAIRRAGNYPVRLALVGLSHPTAGYRTYEDTFVSAGKVRVNNLFLLR